ncbi:glucosyl-3-phosphoglycerate synthase [Anaeroselena agilis]|uniref:Glucosyl-3-phosphoglycerate synthase n=1 Tax=Anaeroselena agilis TaxID=3063788 RepID=A0ABU3P001_9FIRM|nr:glucosyl-3-phosphoglycerate synthase [Selenomonadales bacterium 4137-cl]
MILSCEKWPLAGQDKEDYPVFAIKTFEEWKEEDAGLEGFVAITDGWRGGPVAAVLRGGINARAVLELLAQSGVRDLTIIHLEERIPQLGELFLSTVVMPANAMFESVTVVWRRDPTLEDLISSIGADYEMLLFGAPLTPSEVMPFYGRIRKRYGGSVTVVRGPLIDIEADEGGEIFAWVRERTFDAADFALAAVLRNYKRKRGKKVAVLLPSLNEERTVGNVIKTALEVKEVGIIDEVVLIDSDSSDGTVEVARSYGIPVYLHREIRPELGSHRGKGEAMFKSAFVTDADIIAWVDTDIESIAPRFFYGLLGPMLTNPAVRFSKGYFARPVMVEASGVELGGGRVTEILARPWINAFLPQLSGYIQPLAGTAAIYRDTFMKMRLPVNYGVEMAMLIQAVEMEGLWATCQVNLGEVIHKSKNVIGLSDMAFQIVQVLAEMEPDKYGRPFNELRRVYSAHGRFEIATKKFPLAWRRF